MCVNQKKLLCIWFPEGVTLISWINSGILKMGLFDHIWLPDNCAVLLVCLPMTYISAHWLNFFSHVKRNNLEYNHMNVLIPSSILPFSLRNTLPGFFLGKVSHPPILLLMFFYNICHPDKYVFAIQDSQGISSRKAFQTGLKSILMRIYYCPW